MLTGHFNSTADCNANVGLNQPIRVGNNYPFRGEKKQPFLVRLGER